MIFFAMSQEIEALAFRIGYRSLGAYTRLKGERPLVPCRSWSCRRCNSRSRRLSLGYTRRTMLPSNWSSR